MDNNFPRRISLERMTPVERAIQDVKWEIEKMPGDIRLTEAQVLLSQAQDKVADYVDSLPTTGAEK